MPGLCSLVSSVFQELHRKTNAPVAIHSLVAILKKWHVLEVCEMAYFQRNAHKVHVRCSRVLNSVPSERNTKTSSVIMFFTTAFVGTVCGQPFDWHTKVLHAIRVCVLRLLKHCLRIGKWVVQLVLCTKFTSQMGH